MNPFAAGVLAITVGAVIVRQVRARGPPIWLLFLAGAFAMVAVGALTIGEAGSAVSANLPVLAFLFSLFIFAAGLEQAGALEHLARWIVGRAHRPSDLPLVLFIAFGLVSAFIVNDALVLVGVPLLIALAARLRVSAEPLLLTLAYSVTVGSVLTPFGNPQNLLVSLGSGMTTPVATFLHYLLLPTLVNLLIGGWYLRRTLGARLDTGGAPSAPRPPRVPLLPSSGLLNTIRRFPVLVLFPVTMTGMVTVDVAANLLRGAPVPLYAIALGGAVLVLLVTPGRGELFARADWTILVLFAALFVVVAGAETGGLLAGLQAVQPIPGPGHRLSSIGVILATGLVGSQLVSNVPWVALQIPVLHAAGYGPSNPWAWVALAGGSTLAGNLTLLGAASNLIVVQPSERAGIRIGLTQFVRIGLPITALTVLVLYVFLAIGW